VILDSPTSLFVTAPDGLKLHVRAYGSRTESRVPVVCLPGLARTEADFEVLANVLAGDAARPRHVLALDYRGRGQSDYDRNPGNYNLAVELADTIAVLTALGIGRAVFVGTSRGGILTMLLATVRPAVIAGAVLNDIGPVIETKGLVRIKGYVGQMPPPRDFEDAAEVLRRLFKAQFTKLDARDWFAMATRTFRKRDGRLVPCYDARLATALKGVEPHRPLPPLWKEFDAFSAKPVMIIRGANSDILSPATVAAILARRPDVHCLEVPDQGHAPLLEGDVARAIATFVARC
jgi:pimeloyl-ACP methyl ester carboxylesterase